MKETTISTATFEVATQVEVENSIIIRTIANGLTQENGWKFDKCNMVDHNDGWWVYHSNSSPYARRLTVAIVRPLVAGSETQVCFQDADAFSGKFGKYIQRAENLHTVKFGNKPIYSTKKPRLSGKDYAEFDFDDMENAIDFAQKTINAYHCFREIDEVAGAITEPGWKFLELTPESVWLSCTAGDLKVSITRNVDYDLNTTVVIYKRGGHDLPFRNYFYDKTCAIPFRIVSDAYIELDFINFKDATKFAVDFVKNYPCVNSKKAVA